jgi:ABC-type Fe3+ transport system permease subunit
MQSRVLKDMFNFDMMNATFLDASASTFALVALFLLLSTHCITTIRYSIQRFYDRRYKGKEPSTLPYVLPGVGSAISLIRNPHGFFKSIV